jgi:transcriptional regulator with XRE-family HTH domain
MMVSEGTGECQVEPGAALKAARLERGWTLADVAQKTGLSVSTLSKVENGKSGLNYTTLMKLGQGMGVDIGQLLVGPDAPVQAATGIAQGSRAITRAGSATLVEDPSYIHKCHAAELLRRSLHPMILEVKARSIEEFGELRSHPGEEFTFVLEGAVDLYSQEYAPTRLNAGDSIYFDAGMPHAFIAASEGPCRLLSVFSESQLQAGS